MLAVHCDPNCMDEITMNGYQDRKIEYLTLQTYKCQHTKERFPTVDFSVWTNNNTYFITTILIHKLLNASLSKIFVPFVPTYESQSNISQGLIFENIRRVSKDNHKHWIRFNKDSFLHFKDTYPQKPNVFDIIFIFDCY